MIYVPYRNTTTKVTINPTKETTFDAHRRLFLQPPHAAGLSDGSYATQVPPQTKPGLNLAFLHQFLSSLNIMIPRWRSKETGLFALARRFPDAEDIPLVVAWLDGEIVRDLVAGNGKGFMWASSNGAE